VEPIYIALDLETTGLEPGRDEIIEVGAVKFRGNEVLETYQTLVKPKQVLPIKIARLTGIDAHELTTAPTFNSIGGQLAKFLKSYPIIGHSVDNDLRFLQQQGLKVTQPHYDTFDLATLLIPQLPNYSLSTIAEHLQIQHPDAHRALADAEASRLVFSALLDKLAELSAAELHSIAQTTQKLQWPLAKLFGEIAKRRVQTLWQAPIEFQPKPLVRPVALEPTGNQQELDAQAIGAMFGADGGFSRMFPGYEPRQPQIEMTEAIAEALNQGDTLMIEAPTGTGKSLAYLVPAAQWARQRGERVVISTNTINLQDQLCSKDIPTVQALLAEQPDQWPALRAVQLKGRSNYLCLKRYESFRAHPDHNEDQTRGLLKLQLWLPSTNSGDRAELMLIQGEQQVWNNVNVDPDQCLRQRCSLYNECFFFKARAEAENAHIVVANHALLMSDVKSPGILPRYDHLIIDEAHNLEDVATDQLGFTISQHSLTGLLNDMHSAGGVRLAGGVLNEWTQIFRLSTVDHKEQRKLEDLSADLRPNVDKAREAAQQLFSIFNDIMAKDRSVTQYDPQLRITSKVRRHTEWTQVEQTWENLSINLRKLGDGFGKLQAILDNLEGRDINGYDDLVMRVKGMVNACTELQRQFDLVIYGNEETVAWLTADQRRRELLVQAAPIHVGPLLTEDLWLKKRASILVSATLSVSNSFDYPKQRLGLDEATTMQLDSPFDYSKSTLIYLPTDMPEPNERNYQRAMEDALINLCKATGGRTLALFTANASLKQTYHGISESLEQADISTLAQGMDGSRRSLIQRFKSDPRTVLLGTASFWEGVDVVGDALSVLVITKLPFSVPNDPVFSARSEGFDDAFAEYSVPQAILRFKQGFGRLIRSKDDRGIVVVLDRRLLSKNYGRQFLESLPDCTIQRKPLAELATTAARWLV